MIHTPGHASNHLCLLLEEDGLLLSGDHILNGSTVVIDPPDGDMSDYLRPRTACCTSESSTSCPRTVRCSPAHDAIRT